MDMPSRYPPEVVLENFAKLPTNASYKDLQLFLDANFLPAGSDLVSVVAPDWTPNPPFLEFLNDSTLLYPVYKERKRGGGVVRGLRR